MCATSFQRACCMVQQWCTPLTHTFGAILQPNCRCSQLLLACPMLMVSQQGLAIDSMLNVLPCCVQCPAMHPGHVDMWNRAPTCKTPVLMVMDATLRDRYLAQYVLQFYAHMLHMCAGTLAASTTTASKDTPHSIKHVIAE